MQTDYKQLTAFDGAAIAVIALGLAIIGFEIFASLPSKVQLNLAESMEILDVSKEYVQLEQDVAFYFQTGDKVLQEFNLAFIETFAIPDTLEQVADSSLINYRKVASAAQSFVDSPTIARTYTGSRVLGASIEHQEQAVVSSDIDFRYSYAPPTIEQILLMFSNQ